MSRIFSMIVSVVIGLALTPMMLQAQGLRELQGEVFWIEEGERRTEAGLQVLLQEVDRGDTTNDHGLFRLPLADFFKAGETVTLVVQKPGWLIHRPLGGEVRIPHDPRKEVIEVELLPKGSKLFLSHDQIERLIEEVSDESTKRAHQQEKDPAVDFSRAIRDWAERYGLGVDEARAEIDRWIAQVEATSDDERQLGLAQFAQENFDQAAHHFELSRKGRQERLEELDRQEARIQERQEELHREIARDLQLEGSAHYNAQRFEDAIAAYREIFPYIDREEKPQLWAAANNDLGNALEDQGTRTDGAQGAQLLEQALNAYRSALEVYTRDDLPQDWARTQNNLGIALHSQGIRTGGAQGAQLLEQALNAYRSALVVYTRDDLPQDWARTKNNLGNALHSQGIRTSGAQGAQLLEHALVAFRSALEVYTRDDLPQDWARTKNNLGGVLGDQGIRTGGAQGAQFLEQALAAYRNALEVYTRDDLPQDWATTQSNLGLALQSQGTRTDGAQGAQLLEQALNAYRSALEVYTRDDLPQDWARTQNNLGIALHSQGTRTGGAQGAQFLEQALAAYRNALEVYTRDDLPQDWARTQSNLGNALHSQGTRTDGAQGAQLLEQALSAYRSALEVYTRDDLPQDWARTQNNLGTALANQGSRTGGAQEAQLLEQAIAAFRSALEVYTRDDLPQDWARTQNNLGSAFANQGSRTGGAEGAQLLELAVSAYRSALEVRTRDDLPQDEVRTQSNLGLALEALGKLEEAAATFRELLSERPAQQDVTQHLIGLYHDSLYDYEAAHTLLQDWLRRFPSDVRAQVQLTESLLTTRRYDSCEDQARRIAETASEEPQVYSVQRGFEIAALLARDDVATASDQLADLAATLADQPDEFTTSWIFDGTLHFVRNEQDMPHRGAIIRLFESLNAGHRDVILAGLREVHEQLQAATESAAIR